MSRYDGPTEPDYDRYKPKPVEDIDVPDFDQPEIMDSVLVYREAIDPAEHAAHALIEALATLDQEIATATTLERANVLRKMLKRAWADVTRVSDNAGDKVDRLMEKIR